MLQVLIEAKVVWVHGGYASTSIYPYFLYLAEVLT